MSNPNFPSPGILETTAIDLTTNYRNYSSGISPTPDYIRAFNIPIEDITSLSQIETGTSVRAYLGLAVPGDITSLQLVLVPVDKNNKDILSIQAPDGTAQSSIYDLTTPCPQNCDIDSPLFS